MKSLISVIVPAYNIEKYIERCLQSVCGQTHRNLEIIVVDDGSKDNTGIFVDKLAELDPRIVVVHKKNAGVSAARNVGLDMAKGDYIGFVDGDDVIEADMYERLLENLIKYNADISHCGYQMVFPNRKDYYHNTGKRFTQDTYQGVYDLIKADIVEPGLWNKLYKKSVIGESRLNETIKINEDLLFNYEIFKKSKKAVFEDICPYCYMIRENSASTSKINWNKIEDPLKVIKLMMQQETGKIYELLEKRYLYLLEKVSVMKGISGRWEYNEYCKARRAELGRMLKEKQLQAEYSKKEMVQMKLAVISPSLYNIIHNVYASITGSKDKYKVE